MTNVKACNVRGHRQKSGFSIIANSCSGTFTFICYSHLDFGSLYPLPVISTVSSALDALQESGSPCSISSYVYFSLCYSQDDSLYSLQNTGNSSYAQIRLYGLQTIEMKCYCIDSLQLIGNHNFWCKTWAAPYCLSSGIHES